MHRFKAVFCALLSAAFLSGAGPAPPPRRIDFTPEQQAALDKVNLKANTAITGIDIHNDDFVVHARTSNNRQQGNITLVFSNPQIELRQWTVKDNQGGTTMVALHNPETGVALDDTMFAVPVKTPPVKKAP